MQDRIGIDIGGCIIKKGGYDLVTSPDLPPNNEDTSFHYGANYLKTPAIEGSFEAIKKIVDLLGSNNVFIVSYCGEKTEMRSREWLKANKFFEITGFNETHLFFTRRRSEKVIYCEVLDLTMFVDDSFPVLKPMMDLHVDNPQHKYRHGVEVLTATTEIVEDDSTQKEITERVFSVDNDTSSKSRSESKVVPVEVEGNKVIMQLERHRDQPYGGMKKLFWLNPPKDQLDKAKEMGHIKFLHPARSWDEIWEVVQHVVSGKKGPRVVGDQSVPLA